MKNTLSTNFEYNITRKYGQYVSGRYFHAYILKPNNYTGPTKTGIVTSSKLHKRAVVRNRIKRVFREVLKNNIEKFGQDKWVVVHPKKNSLEKGYEEINTDFAQALQKVSFTN